MSRILDALRKAESGGTTPAPIPRARPPKGEARVELERPSPPSLTDELPAQPPGRRLAPEEIAIEVPQRVEVVEPAEIAEPWQSEVLPGIPQDFHRELSGMRLQIDSALAGRHPRVLMISSSSGGEGSTTVAASFARVLAQDEASSVLLVDANVRRPGVSLFFDLPGGPGLSEILNSRTSFDDTVQAVERPNLHVVSSLPGQITGGHLYAQQLVRAFLSQYGARYDYVIIDAPPVLEAPETIVLGGVVDTTLLVVRAATTKSGVVNRAIDVLAKASVPVLGLILNRRRHDIPEFIYQRI